ncbi:uncharacterized protein BDV17DRAFT_248613 [Aspergillus undulatus]|uniref:uncharacterized protein n=1 Tax=Aspergillus undulatus TaxID=1810928 RepID=UPI003CCE48BA
MPNLRQLYPTVTYLRVCFPFSKHRASIAQSVRRYSDFGEEKESGIQKPSSSDSAEGEKGGRKGQASKEHPESSTAINGSKEHEEYYSLKNYREGPNTESGELGSKHDKEGVDTHNKDIKNRLGKD